MHEKLEQFLSEEPIATFLLNFISEKGFFSTLTVYEHTLETQQNKLEVF